jgi:hypothetical protein
MSPTTDSTSESHATQRPVQRKRTERAIGLLSTALIALVAAAWPARAFIDPVVIVPAQPIAGQPIAFSVRIGVCEYLQAGGPSNATTIFATDQWRTIERVGNTLQVTVRALYAPDENACIYPTAIFQFGLGTLSPGGYRIELYGQAISDPTFRPLIGSAQFVVGAPASIPVNDRRAIALLVLTITATGAAWLLRRQST